MVGFLKRSEWPIADRTFALKPDGQVAEDGRRSPRAMSQPPDNSHYVRRVVLPSGRSIEVVYFENEPPPAAPATPADLHVCPECEAHLVYPVEWEEHDLTHWQVSLRCPNCEWAAIDVYAQETVDRFDEELDRGTEALVRDLKQLTFANMEDEVDRFVRALQADAILPEDF
jgi:hypothetical protein